MTENKEWCVFFSLQSDLYTYIGGLFYGRHHIVQPFLYSCRQTNICLASPFLSLQTIKTTWLIWTTYLTGIGIDRKKVHSTNQPLDGHRPQFLHGVPLNVFLFNKVFNNNTHTLLFAPNYLQKGMNSAVFRSVR